MSVRLSVYLQENCSAVPEGWVLSIRVKGMELEGVTPSEMSQSEKNNCPAVSLVSGSQGTGQRVTAAGRENGTGRNRRGRQAVRDS